MKKYALTVISVFSFMIPVFSEIILESPVNGYTSCQVYSVRGSIPGYAKNAAILIINGLPQTIPVKGGRFSMKAVASPGNNLVEIQAGRDNTRVSFFAKVPPRDIKVLLTWDTPSYVDLWVTDPKGEKCYWASPVSSSGGNLVYDDSNYAPQTFTMVKAVPGTYSIQIQNYGSFGHPVSRVKVYLLLYEGTSREEHREWQFTATKERTVYHIADFQIEENP